jgi:hypothetical protein
MGQLLKSVVSIPYHEDLAADLTFAEWTFDPFGRSKLLEKAEQRKATGRSPDFGDAVAYCLWEGRVAPLSEVAAEARAELEQPEDAEPSRVRDAYAGIGLRNPGRERGSFWGGGR